MIVRRVVKNDEGEIEATLMLSPEQAAFLINMGLVTLVTAGTAQVQDMSEEEFNAQIKKEQEQKEQQSAGQGDGGGGVITPEPANTTSEKQKQFLAIVDKDTLHKA